MNVPNLFHSNFWGPKWDLNHIKSLIFVPPHPSLNPCMVAHNKLKFIPTILCMLVVLKGNTHFSNQRRSIWWHLYTHTSKKMKPAPGEGDEKIRGMHATTCTTAMYVQRASSGVYVPFACAILGLGRGHRSIIFTVEIPIYMKWGASSTFFIRPAESDCPNRATVDATS